MAKEKLWSEVSKEEKDEVMKIEKRQSELKERYLKGEISQRAYRYNLTMLIKRVDEVERKYE